MAQTLLTSSLNDPDGHMGFPGTVVVQCRYSLTSANELTIDIHVTSDAHTVFNAGHHSYFCLDNSGDIFSHELMIAPIIISRREKETFPRVTLNQ